jgi:predicted  nucleic acid-binding Zn-ribbon protein
VYVGAELETLFQLQRVDERLLGKRRDIETYEKRLAERRAAMEACKARLDELGRRRKQAVSDRAFAERGLADLQEKLRERKQRVGRVRTEKELRASQDEVRALSEEIGNAETEVLTMMEQVDAVEREIEAARKDYEDLAQADHRDVADEAARIDALRADLEAIRSERSEIASTLPPGLLKKYDVVLERRHGVAVVVVPDGRTCGGCHMQVPPQALIEIRRSSAIHVCPNCQRILYVPAL